MPPAQGPTSTSTAQLAVASRLDALLTAIQPSSLSEFRRLTIAHYICGVIKRCFQPHHQVEAFMFGSVPLRAVLPDGDIDISVFTTAAAAAAGPAGGAAGAGPPGELRDTWASQLLRALEREAVRPDAPFKIRDVQIIQAEVKLVKCVASDVVVDVSFDTVGGLCTVAFLEAADRRIGRQHLFKRSILLLKAWCYYESRLLGAHHGLISSYALEVLVLYIFNLHHADLHTPLDVLRRFLAVLGSFDWERYCLALQGPLPLAELHDPHVHISQMPPGVTPLLDDEFMQHVLQQYSVQQYLAPHGAAGGAAAWGGGAAGRGAGPAPGCALSSAFGSPPTAPAAADSDGGGAAMPLVAPHFPLKHLNIVDPLLLSNNLGRSVSKASFARVRKALALGSRTLEAALVKDPRSAVEAVDQFFRNTWRSPVRMAADNQTFLARLSTTQLPPAATEAVVSAAAAAGFPLHAASPSPSPRMVQAPLAMPAHVEAALPAGMDSLPSAQQLAAAAAQQQQHQQQRQQPTVPQLASLQILTEAGRHPPGAYSMSAQQQQAMQQQLLQARLNGMPAVGSYGRSQSADGDSKSHSRSGRQSPTAPPAAAAAAAAAAAPAALAGGTEPASAAGVAQPAAAAGGVPADAGSTAAVQQVQQQEQEVNAAAPADSQQQRQQQVDPPGGLMDGWQGGRPPLAQPVMAVGVGGLAATAPNTPVAATALGKLGAGVPYLAASSQLGALRQGMGYAPSGGRWSPTAASPLSSGGGARWSPTAASPLSSGGGARWSPTAASALGGAAGALAAPRQPPARLDSPHSFFGGDLQAMERNLMLARRRQRVQQQQQQQTEQQQQAEQRQQQAERQQQAAQEQQVMAQQQAAQPGPQQQEVQQQAAPPPPPPPPSLQLLVQSETPLQQAQQHVQKQQQQQAARPKQASKGTASSDRSAATRPDVPASLPGSDGSAPQLEGDSTTADQQASPATSANADQAKENAASQGKRAGAAPSDGALALFLSPLKAVLRVRREHALGDLNPLPFTAIIANCSGWVAYAFVTGDVLVLWPNVCGVLLSLFYTLSAYGLADNKARDRQLAIVLGFSAALMAVGAVGTLGTLSHSSQKTLWGFTANAFLIVVYASPLTTIFEVVRSRSSATLHLPLSVMYAVNGGLWLVYGLAITDPFLSVPNGIGAALGLTFCMLICL
ncbi:hypothetical protein C2E20_3343 [Micractinium conductrix]|uniref:PAP/OAS1 substrate-binding-related domain-containing protein n=1 Tax=Micractinium conductrix TaxID=554055 RepID=A0A2P6VGQ5_9CHLO|nr:hypothetical protein C2E20_3343 [Micractinium conductrix]|eukprot:PSC73275.1 hypothetical protein C2E20_3343 [Micractinium conductrix]